MCDRALRYMAVEMLKDHRIPLLYANRGKDYVQDAVNEYFHGISIVTLHDMYTRYHALGKNMQAFNTAWYSVVDLIDKTDENDKVATKCYLDRLNEIRELHNQTQKEQRVIVNNLVKLIKS